MVDTIIPFTPNENGAPPFQSQLTIAEGLVTISTLWNMSGERWYLKVEDSRGSVLLFRPMISSTQDEDINLIGSISASSLVYRENNQVLEVTV